MSKICILSSRILPWVVATWVRRAFTATTVTSIHPSDQTGPNNELGFRVNMHKYELNGSHKSIDPLRPEWKRGSRCRHPSNL